MAGSGRSVHFITDEGDVYYAPLASLLRVMKGEQKVHLMGRFANGVSPDRFQKSPVWGTKESSPRVNDLTTDSFSYQKMKDKKEEKTIEDIKVW